MVEDLVSDSVALLDAQHAEGDERVCGWIAALYRFQDGFDCSFTHFRVMDALVRRGYVVRFPLDRHPDYARRRDYFESLTEFTALREFDEEADDFEGYAGWLEDGYVEPPFLYCDAGTELWRRMVGESADPPRRTSLFAVLHAVAVAAEKVGDVSLITDWYDIGPYLLTDGSPVLDELQEDPDVIALRAVVHRTGAHAAECRTGYRPPLDAIEDDELMTWWYVSA